MLASMQLRGDSFSQAGLASVSIRCPACRQISVLETFNQSDWHVSPASLTVGQRRCPNPECHTHLFVVHEAGRVAASYPPEVIDLDSTNVPENVVAALEEAIKCHANQCYIAGAIMVRKTLEELCADRGASGANLKERIGALGTKVVLPKELLDGLDDLRLLGNDAAHIESKEYDSVGREEVEVGIEFTKEVLKGVYQMSELLSRLRALKATP